MAHCDRAGMAHEQTCRGLGRCNCPSAVRSAFPLAHLESDSAGVIDPNATRGAIAARISELEVLHTSSPTKAGKPRAPIPWPRLPARLDWDDLPHPPRGVVEDPLMSQTIAVARWVADLATVWSNVETNRLSREHLAGEESVAQAMPVVLTAGKPA